MREQILALRAKGYTYDQIRDELKCSKGTVAYYLGEGQKEKTLKRQNGKRAEISRWKAGLKDNQHCVDCGVAYRHWIMEFDHLRDKEFNIGQYRSHTSDLERIKREVEKCEIVCANCHKDRTYRRMVEKDAIVENLAAEQQENITE